MDAADFLTTDEIIAVARRNLSDWQWAYLVGGAESETTLRRNRLALDSIGLRPRVLRDVSKIDTSVSFLGHRLRMPVILAPVRPSRQHLVGRWGDRASRGRRRSSARCSSMAQMTPPSLEEVAAASDGPEALPALHKGDDDWLRALLTRVRNAGYEGLVLDGRFAVPRPSRAPAAEPGARASNRGAVGIATGRTTSPR